jgi:hypothetical protein
MKIYLNYLGMISYTLSILFFAPKPIVKKVLSIEIVIFHAFTLSEAYSNTSGTYGSVKDVERLSYFWQFFTSCSVIIQNSGTI